MAMVTTAGMQVTSLCAWQWFKREVQGNSNVTSRTTPNPSFQPTAYSGG
jgi:hypothetical protein